MELAGLSWDEFADRLGIDEIEVMLPEIAEHYRRPSND